MVKTKRKLLPAIIAALCITLLSGGCGGSRSAPGDTGSESEGSAGSEGSGDAGSETIGSTGDSDETAFGGGSPDPDDKNPASVMVKPDTPPDGQRYDEWKGFQYTDQTEFDVRTFWTFSMYNHSKVSDYDLIQDPEDIEDAMLTIIDCKAEPVGGEMKLRSGGYVDITVEVRWTGTMNGKENMHDSIPSWLIRWQENTPYPCDAYTGTSLLNYTASKDEKSGDISPGQATATSMVESDVTFNGRTYRLFAKSDIRNSSGGNWSTDFSGDYFTFSCPGSVDTTFTFRVPADYDGLVLAIDKDITDQKSVSLDEAGEFLEFDDLYADILTTSTGVKQSVDDFYFVRVSDLIEHFKDSEHSQY